MIKVCVLVLVLLMLVWIRFVYADIIVVLKKIKTYNAFQRVNVYYESKYELISKILFYAKGLITNEQIQYDKLNQYCFEVINLKNVYENIDRKINLDNVITINMDKIISLMNNYPNLKTNFRLNELIKKYQNLETNMLDKKNNYNKLARSLRKCTEVFPYSFLARKRNILPVDYML